jgi:hypothetical protein
MVCLVVLPIVMVGLFEVEKLQLMVGLVEFLTVMVGLVKVLSTMAVFLVSLTIVVRLVAWATHILQ